MKRRWPLAIAYSLALLVQAGLLAGAYELDLLSRTKMGVFRYLVAQNVGLESSWFSPQALLVQVGAFLILAGAAVVAALALGRRRSWSAAAQAAVGAGLAAWGAWLTTSVSVDDAPALYAIVAAAWGALLVQTVVVAVASRLRGRTVEEAR